MNPPELAVIQRQSVQDLPDARKEGQTLDLNGMTFERGPILMARGTRAREEQLRNIYYHDYNWMVQGAFAGIMKLIASTPWEIKGPDSLPGAQEKYYRRAYKAAGFGRETTTNRPDIEYWQAYFRKADFGRGWASFCMKGVDYLRQDAGWVWEIVGPGNPSKPLTGAATALAHLDSLRCIPTGDPEFPVMYISRDGKLHLMHHTRIVQMQDMPDGDERRPGYGLCALSRAISIVYREVLMGRFIEASLDDKPKPGIIVAAGMNENVREKALQLYINDTTSDEPKPWGRTMWFFGADRDSAPELTLNAFAEAPEKFDFERYTAQVDVNALALAIGVDVQDLWQLTGGSLGSGQQSEILNQKSRGKTVGTLRTEIERNANDVLPEEYEFAFKYRDAMEDQERATTAKAWADAVASASSHLMEDEARHILADRVEAFSEALRDESGEVRTRDDLDVLAPGQGDNDVTRTDNAQTGGPSGQTANPAGTAGAGGQRPNPAPDVGRSKHADSIQHDTKQFQATRLNFEIEWADLIEAAKSGDMPRARFRIVARALLRRHGLDAYRDGLKAGGVDTQELDDDDQAEFAAWLTRQSEFVSGVSERLYVQQRNENAEASAEMWANKSLQEIYYLGLNSANRNAMFEFAGEDGVESCGTCKRLKGQRHRMKDWTRKRLRPGVDTENFKCGGFFCNHTLIPTQLTAYGRF